MLECGYGASEFAVIEFGRVASSRFIFFFVFLSSASNFTFTTSWHSNKTKNQKEETQSFNETWKEIFSCTSQQQKYYYYRHHHILFL